MVLGVSLSIRMEQVLPFIALGGLVLAHSASASTSKSAASIGGKPASTTASSVLESARHLDADLEGLFSGGLAAWNLVVLPDSSLEGPVTSYSATVAFTDSMPSPTVW